MHVRKKSLWLIIALIAATSAALVLGNRTPISATPHPIDTSDDVVQLSTRLVQDKILIGSDGAFSMALDLAAAEIPHPSDQPRQRVDLVVVLDRSGSMQGQKLNDAREAIIGMLGWLSPEDRLALVVYDTTIQTVFPLTGLSETHRRDYAAVVGRITAGGGTNLGGGLQSGIDALMRFPAEGRQRKVILISDGLANHGITDPAALGRMAMQAAAQRIAVSTVGVGYDFNESLMTALADHGTGRYHFLENPNAFAAVLGHEFQTAHDVAASGLEIRIPLKHGLKVTDAGGYPVRIEGQVAVIQPGDLLSAERRRIFLSLQIPADKARQYTLDSVTLRYQHAGRPRTLVSGRRMRLACVADDNAVVASIDQAIWGSRVVQEDFGRLKESVADAIRKGEKGDALRLIHEYETRTSAVNSSLKAPQVTENLAADVQVLRQGVEETFSGAPAAVAEKQKKSAKALQYDAYQSRRAKK